MNHVDKMRLKQQALGLSAKPAPKADNPTPAKEADRPTPKGEVVAVIHRCGHQVNYKAPAKQEQVKAFIEKRAAKMCKSCNIAEEERKKQERKARPRKSKDVSGEKRDRQMNRQGRLPDGSAFSATYNAKEEMWSGRLGIPDCPVFDAKVSGVFRLMQALDKLYRQHAAKQSKGPTDEQASAALGRALVAVGILPKPESDGCGQPEN